ncbi:hypothetical protein ODIN_1 [Mycobacterium phage Odin]|nr:hypothetical protein ODIN_1 [Mycobacterium phage Odin]
MGGRGGKGGAGPGTGAKNKKAAGAGTSSGAAGGGGSSAGSSGSGGKGTGSAGTGGVTGGGGSGGSAGGGSSTSTQQPKALAIQYGEGLTEAEKAKQQKMFDKLPDHLKKRLFDSGTKIWVGTRADKTPGWAEFAKETGYDSNSKIADGREIGSLSFYLGSRNELFISVHHPGGSVNVYTHELGHALDYQMIGGTKLREWPPGSGDFRTVRIISDDPEWAEIHAKEIVNNQNINSYYRGGPSGKDPVSGRKELFAEGFAVYNEYGRSALVGWVKSEKVADTMIDIWKRYGVIK